MLFASFTLYRSSFIMRDFLDERPIKLRRGRSGARASRRPFLLILVLCVLVAILLFLDENGRLGPTRGVLQQVLSPATRTLTALRDTIGDLMSRAAGTSELQTRVHALEQQVSQLQAELLARELAQVENEQLRSQLAIKAAHPWRLLGAEVVVRSPDGGRRVMTIARGSNDGVAIGMAVVGQLGGSPAALVGIVEQVGPRTADVLLVTDFGSQVSGRVLHGSAAWLGIVQGRWQRGSRLRIEQLERGATLAAGDSVVSAGLTEALHLPLALAAVPSNIPIGVVEQVSNDDQGLSAELRPYVDPDQVRYVWVILSQDG